MRKVRALDKNDDWTFGRGLVNYIDGHEAIVQKVICRIRSFKNDNPLNMDENIDWIGLLGDKNKASEILREVERVTLATTGVVKINSLSHDIDYHARTGTITINFETVYDTTTEEVVI